MYKLCEYTHLHNYTHGIYMYECIHNTQVFIYMCMIHIEWVHKKKVSLRLQKVPLPKGFQILTLTSPVHIC